MWQFALFTLEQALPTFVIAVCQPTVFGAVYP
jgi:hypothetical protein